MCRNVFPGFWDGVSTPCFHLEPRGLDTDLDDILHPEEKEEVPHGVACGFHRGHINMIGVDTMCVQIVGMGKEW